MHRSAAVSLLLLAFSVQALAEDSKKTQDPGKAPASTTTEKKPSDSAQAKTGNDTTTTATSPEDNALESHGQIPKIDVGVSFGYNNPAGMIGLEGEYRLMEYLGVGLEGGIGGWGVRLSPVVHGYPFGASNLGIYGELAASLNLGGPSHYLVGTADSNVNLGLTPALSLSVGYRRQWLTFFWTAVKLGYQWRVGGRNVTVTGGTNPLSQEQIDAIDLSSPGTGIFGGFVFGGSAGIAFL